MNQLSKIHRIETLLNKRYMNIFHIFKLQKHYITTMVQTIMENIHDTMQQREFIIALHCIR